MVIIKPAIFCQFPEIIFGFSTKIGYNGKAPYHFNLSLSVGDDFEQVKANRTAFYSQLGLRDDEIAYQRQIHGDTIRIVDKAGFSGESDALITKTKGIGLAVSTGDCVTIFLYSSKSKIIGAIHSGWKSTALKITSAIMLELSDSFSVSPAEFYAYIAPAIQVGNYQVDVERANNFESQYYTVKENKAYLDLISANYDMLINSGVQASRIQRSELCSFEYHRLLHSYRREGAESGRAYGIIGMRAENK